MPVAGSILVSVLLFSKSPHGIVNHGVFKAEAKLLCRDPVCMCSMFLQTALLSPRISNSKVFDVVRRLTLLTRGRSE